MKGRTEACSFHPSISKAAQSCSSSRANGWPSATMTCSGWVRRFERFPKVQVIDLDAAMGVGDNLALVRQIAAVLSCRVGGGVRTIERATEILAAGAQTDHRWSALFRAGRPDLDFAKQLADAIDVDRVIAAVDSRAGQVVIHGWKTPLPISAVEAVRAARAVLRRVPLHARRRRRIDGGDRHREAILEVRRATTRRVTAAGGITTQEEIDDLDRNGVDAVVGMALYTGKLAID